MKKIVGLSLASYTVSTKSKPKVITGMLPWQPVGIKFAQLPVAKNHFRPCRKNYALDRKMIDTF